MASSNNLSAALLVISLLTFSAFTSACSTCAPPVKKPPPCGTPPSPASESCPKNALKLGVCADVLRLVNVAVGAPVTGSKCCELIKGLADLEAAVCLCTALKANVLGINLDVPVTLSLLVSACAKSVPPGFQCK